VKPTILAAASLAALLAAASPANAQGGRLSGVMTPKAKGDTPHFLPTLSAALGVDTVDAPWAGSYANFWLGVSHYPLSQSWSPFYSVGAELDLRTRLDPAGGESKTVPVFGAQVRGGVSFFPDNNGYLSVFNGYTFLGYRGASGFDEGALRIGLGVSSPGIGLLLLTTGLPIPWMCEVAIDLTGDASRLGGRFGISY
jgi:hypothetical protein